MTYMKVTEEKPNSFMLMISVYIYIFSDSTHESCYSKKVTQGKTFVATSG